MVLSGRGHCYYVQGSEFKSPAPLRGKKKKTTVAQITPLLVLNTNVKTNSRCG